LFWRYDQEKAVRSGDLKLIDRAGAKLLYDVASDPGEATNLAADRPDDVARLDALLSRWETDVATNR
jgi:arylsulfatase A-like enzyme